MWPRWLRALATIWVAWDSKKRRSLDLLWVLIIFLLGPLLVPVYMSVRPLTKNETRKGGLLWNIFVNAEQFFIWLAGIAITAVFAENFTMPHDKDIADIKRAEIKAGSIMGAVLLLLLLGLERIFFAGFRKKIEG